MYSAIDCYRSVLSSVFIFCLPDISTNFILKDLMRSFKLERPLVPNRAPPWDLLNVLDFLRGPPFEPITSASLRDLSRKLLFMVSFASARRIGELHAVSRKVPLQGSDVFLSYLPEFRAKTESEGNPLSRSFIIKGLDDFVGDMQDELLLCLVRALEFYLNRTRSLSPRPRSLFVSPKKPILVMSKNAISFFLRDVICCTSGIEEGPGPSTLPRAHSIRGVSTSASFLRNFSLSKVLEAATWKSSSVFTSFLSFFFI